MRRIFACLIVVLTCITAQAAFAEDLQVAKVYRDYPGYINPAVCENPNMNKASSAQPEDQIQEQRAIPAAAQPQPATPTHTMSPAPVVPSGDAPQSVTPATLPAMDTLHATQPAAQSPAAEPPGRCCPSYIFIGQDNPVDVLYLSAWGGVVATHDTDIEHVVDLSFDNGYGLGLAIGYDFGPMRLEIEASHRDSNGDKVKIGGVTTDLSADLKVKALMLNGYADFNPGGAITPYLGAGVGLANVELDDEDDDVLAGQVAAGVLFAFSPEVAVDLGYRFMMTEDPDIGGAEFEVRQHTAMLGLQIRF